MAELAEFRTLMAASIRELIDAYLDPVRVDASFEITGVDTQLTLELSRASSPSGA